MSRIADLIRHCGALRAADCDEKPQVVTERRRRPEIQVCRQPAIACIAGPLHLRGHRQLPGVRVRCAQLRVEG